MKQKFEKPIEHSDEYYYCFLNQSRRILLYAEINSDTAYVLNFKLNAFALEDKNKPIILELNSEGGDVCDGFSIIDTIERLKIKTPIYTLISGIACSMAAIISLTGTKRFITPNAYWMQHAISGTMSDYLQHMKDATKFFVRLEKQSEEIMKKYTKLAKKDYEKINNGELWLNSKEALEKGIVDEILYPNAIIK